MSEIIRIDEKWQMENDYTVTCISDASLFNNAEVVIPRQLHKFFGAEAGETRIIFLFEGREFPSYVECGFGEDPQVNLSWSKALNSKFIGLFPDYQNFFEHLTPANQDERPIIKIEKMEAQEFLIKMILPSDAALTVKQSLFDYLGPGKTVMAFKSSYEIVFLKSYFEQADNRGKADVFMVSAAVKKFYEAREIAGNLQDKNAEKTIDDVQTAGLDDILSFLLEGPYAIIAEKGFLSMETIDEHFYFAMEVSLLDELSTDDRRLITEMLESKITYYFDRFDGPGLSENLSSLMYDYNTYYNRDFRYSFKDILTDGIPGSIEALRFVDGERYRVTGFAGEEEWTDTPWIDILDRNITRVPNEGVFVQYILNKDTQKLFLALSHGFRDIEEEILKKSGNPELDTKPLVSSVLQPLVREIQGKIDAQGMSLGNPKVDLYDDRFRDGIIFYKEYSGQVPRDNELEIDLQIMLELYHAYYEHFVLKLYPDPEPEPEVEEVAEEPEAEAAPVVESESEEEREERSEITEEEAPAIPEVEETVTESVKEAPEQAVEVQAEVVDTPEDVVEETVDKPVQPVEKTGSEPVETVDKEEETVTEAVETVEKPVENIVEVRWETVDNPPEPQPTQPTRPVRSISEAAYLQTKRVMEESASGEAEETGVVERILERVENLVETPADIQGTLKQLAAYITANGFTCENSIVENMYLCLKAKPFIILTGIAGIGKSSLARLFAEAMGANMENSRYKQVPVRPDWTDSRGLLGYLDLNGRFVPGALNDFIKSAVEDPRKPYFLCLDEMNLARVEYYFSEILSVMETRRDRGGHIMTDPLLGSEIFGRDELARERYGELYLPENLFIIGTVSSEETAFNLSRKVLDRASLIEISQVSLHLQSMPSVQPEPIKLGSSFLKSDVLVLANCSRQRDMIQEVVTLLEAMNGILLKASAQIGFRVRDEICFYLLYNAEHGLMSQEDALDHAILQKILPRIQGGGSSVEAVLTDLFKICAGTRSGSAVRNYPGNRGGLFPHSAEKLSAMVKRFDQEGKTSFWS